MALPPLVLASSSLGRRRLLEGFGLPFVWQAPDIDETPLPDESAEDLVWRLSREKAERVALRYPDAVIVASDQVADLDGQIFGKPDGRQAAMMQLCALRGHTVCFHNGLTVLDTIQGSVRISTERVTVHVDYRALSEAEIARYLEREQPWFCAGSLRSEAMGSAIVERIRSDDPAALIGLPLITLARLLRVVGYVLP